MPLKGFRNLISLELYNFYGNEYQLIKGIVDVLAGCPNLETLGLAKLCACDAELPESVILDGEDGEDGECRFLEKLCDSFDCRGGSPLKIHTLRLGTGIIFHGLESGSDDGNNYLAKLVDLSRLKCLHMFNDLVKWDIDEEGLPLLIN
jgi:hypothetical protein